MKNFLRVGIVAAAAAASLASAAQQQNQQPNQYGAQQGDPTYCTEACAHYYQCKGIDDAQQISACAAECQQSSTDPQTTYTFSQLPCDQTIALVEGNGGAQQGGAQQPQANVASCPGTVDLYAGPWGHGGGQMYEITFYRNGTLQYRMWNMNAGTVTYGGRFSLECPNVHVVLDDNSRLEFTLDQTRLVGDGANWGVCSGECF